MPTYDYSCTTCSHTMEAFQKITDSPLSKCPACGKNSLRRGPGGGIGLSFKGNGFYITDYGPNKEHAKKETACGQKSEGSKEGCPCAKQTQSS